MRVATGLALAVALLVAVRTSAQPPAVGIVDAPTVTVLRGLSVPNFEAEMQFMNTALGVGCGFCHARGNFASDSNPRKAKARTMLEMTKAINEQFFAARKAADGQLRLGAVTCFTCHQGNERPKTPDPAP